ncbi:DUF6338 family protein [Candidatus Poriferisodalis sp.]|uniref:DUF6338 family protein n=1 Tax=Candidatus Poriferisodalis sp. TaxID=3101277 RepID=UPI003B52FDA8
MSSGYDAALLLLVLLLPGAFAAWGFERHVQRYGRRLKDWLLRLAGLSAVCLAVGAWPLHWVVSSYWDDFIQGRALPRYVFLAPVAYLAVPAAVGWSLGLLMRPRNLIDNEPRMPLHIRLRSVLRPPILRRIASTLPAPNRAPTAWDALFDAREAGFVRCRLRSGRWVGGLYAKASPVSSYVGPEGPDQDIYIAHAAEFDQGTGEPALREDEDEFVWLNGGILLKWADIESLEFMPLAASGREGFRDDQG